VNWKATVRRQLARRGFELRRTSWDGFFRQWVADARAKGGDPNELGDSEWSTDRLDIGLERYYMADSAWTILELGPGTGRLSRHLAGHCQHLILVDSSHFVCDWLSEYLKGKGSYEVHRIEGSAAPMVADASVDAVYAHGVMEHLDIDVIYWFLRDFRRILKPGGRVAFNFDNVMTEDSLKTMLNYSDPDKRSIFKFHHPGAIEYVAHSLGFKCEIECLPERIAFAKLTLLPSG
jgi:SAM-dependent methyltransferase